MTPEALGDFMNNALEQGALDAYYTPIFMKKSPKHAVNVNM